MENIWIICHYAQEPPLNTMLRYHNWGKQLVKRGYKVTIIAASTIHNTDIDIVERNGAAESICDGIRYRYIKTPRYQGNGTGRIKNMLAFCFGLKQFSKEKPDVIVNCEAYLFPFVRYYFHKVPVITDTVDLWPESIIEYAGYSKTNPMIKMLYKLEKNAYLKSDALIFSMEGGPEYLKEQPYAKKIDFDRVFHINMGCDMEAVERNYVERKTELPWDLNKFNIAYCGSIRKANQVGQLCEGAEEIERRGIHDVVLHIYGNGDELDSLKVYVKNHNIHNVLFYGRIEREKIPYILSHAKANIMTYKQVPLMKYGGSQSKLFDYLASGRPIICNAKWGYNLIERYDCGIVTEDQTPKAFADAVEKLYRMDNEAVDHMGQNSRRVAEMYDQPILVDKLCEVFDFISSKNAER